MSYSRRDTPIVTCWISGGENGTVDVLGAISDLPIYVAPTLTLTPSPTPVTPTATATLPSGDAIVTGLVWEDSNQNLTLEGMEERLVGVSLRLWQNSCGAGTPWNTQTDSIGEYAFNNLPVGSYCLEVLLNTLPTPANYWVSTTHPGGSVNFNLTDAGLQIMFGLYDVP